MAQHRNVADYQYARRTCLALRAAQSKPCEHGCGDECDCHDSETIVLATGYAEAYPDGTVYSYGREIYNFGEM